MWALFSFKGRTSRLGYWRVQLLASVLIVVFWGLGLFAMLGVGPIGGLLFAPMALALPIMVATWFRRLHDRGKGLWWALFFLVGPTVLLGVAQMVLAPNSFASTLEALPLRLAGLAIVVWAFIELGFVRGQPDANRFGNPPAVGR